MLSNNYIHGIDYLFMYLSFLFSSMINHGYAPDTSLQANMIPIPKGARANVTDSNMYRSIAISSIMSKILDNVIIEQQQFALSTSAYQLYKYNLANSDWISDIESLLAKVEKKSHSGINNLDVSTVKELCHMRDNSYCNILSYHDLIKLIEDICIN